MRFSIFFICMVFSMNLYAQSVDRAGEIIRLSQMESVVQEMVTVYLNKFQKDNPKIPQSKWASIKSGIDHSTYIKGVADLYRNRYNEKELDELITVLRAGDLTRFYTLTERTKDDLYTLSMSHGKKISQYIFDQLGK